MFTKTLLSTTAFAAVASAYIPNLQPRQTDTGIEFTEECQSAMMDLAPLYSAMPTPPPVVMTATAADPCATPDLSGSELSQYESYMSAVSDWADSNSAALASALEECSELTQYASVPVCTGSAAQPTGSSSDDSSSSSDDTSDDTSSDTSSDTGTDEPSNTEDASTTETPGAASRETGMMAAAVVAAAGVLGFLL
ncbi:hypothetical protein DL764_001170 [Monosporascus ibericus]|uniref:Infection structure specific protein n=1 Tax=Monosporascus ibericus TaxID=155417 RepID=A0A4Q4TSA1_9PEZI|nr:hypothetical protein DL764_001170 [Monosporascus ibericus]